MPRSTPAAFEAARVAVCLSVASLVALGVAARIPWAAALARAEGAAARLDRGGGPTLAPPYRLGPGDVVAVTVWGYPDLSATVEIRPDGFAAFPLAGEILAAGLTPAELAQAITDRLGNYVRDPRVTAVLQRLRTLTVSVLGAVSTPGTYQLPVGSRVTQLLGQSGGPLEDADLGRGVLTRVQGDGASIPLEIDLEAILQGRSEAPVLVTGDVLFIPRARPALVLGAVHAPGAYAVRPGMRLLDLLALAGGPTEEADLSGVRIMATPARGGAGAEPGTASGGPEPMGGRGDTSTTTVDLLPVLQLPDHPGNRPVPPGAVLFVPRRPALVSVVGEVARPGSYPLRPGMRALEAMAAAGGPLTDADRSGIVLLREGPVRLDYDAMLEGVADDLVNPALRAGDVLVVPRAERRVVVLGSVATPGALPLREGMRLLEAVALAGGPSPGADLSRLTLTRASGATEVVDFASVMAQPGSEANRLLQPGDVVHVPPTREVLVLGAVVRPGPYVPPPQARLLDVLGLAGGVRQDVGVGSILVTRSASRGEAFAYNIDYLELISRPAGELNLPLRGGEVVYVPAGRRDVLVLGQVKNPGVYQMPTDRQVQLLDVLAMAGGPTPRARLESVGLLRRDGERVEARAGRGATLFQGPARENPTVRPGDVVFVPETPWPDWRDVFGFIVGVNSFVDLIQRFDGGRR